MNSSVCAKTAALVLFFFPLLPLSSLEVHWYLSDAAGIAYRETSSLRSRTETWVLEIRTASMAKEIATEEFPLPDEFQSLNAVATYELAVLHEKGQLSMRSFSAMRQDGSLVARHTMQAGRQRFERANEAGNIVEELFSEEGMPQEHTLLEYLNDRLRSIKRYRIKADGSEELINTDRYRYTRDGSLRGIWRSFPDATRSGLILSSKQGRTERLEMISQDDRSTIIAFDDQARERARYARSKGSSSVTPLEMTTWNPVLNDDNGKRKIERRIEFPDNEGKGRRAEEYNDRGELVTATLYAEDDTVLERSEQLWEAGKLMVIITDRGNDRFETQFDYDESGTLVTETNLMNEQVQRIVRYSKADGIVVEEEEVYVNGALRLVIRYENGVYQSEKRILSRSMDR